MTSNAFENGAYELLQFESEFENNELELEFEAETGKNYSASTKSIQVIIHNISRQPKNIKTDGKKVDGTWNANSKTLSVPVQWNTKNETEIKIKLNK